MKFCPTCQTRYDEEILRFCTKDGTPLIEEGQPNFIQMPSESLEAAEDDLGEETIVRRTPPVNPLPVEQPEFEERRNSAPRIVIPTEQQRDEPQIRSKTIASHQPAQKSNTAKVVFLTVLGTLIVLAGASGVFWLLQSERPNNANTNVNADLSNVNTGLNTALNIDNSFNLNLNANANISANTNANINANINANANLRTPTPTPKPTPSRTPSPSPTPNANTSTNLSNANVATPANTRPALTPSPRFTPRPTEPEPPVNRPVNAGVLNGRALNLPTPAYPSAARQIRASGQVTVQVSVDEEGNVLSARAVSGHPLLRQSAEAAARQSRFNPVRVSGQPVRANGVLVYNFVN